MPTVKNTGKPVSTMPKPGSPKPKPAPVPPTPAPVPIPPAPVEPIPPTHREKVTITATDVGVIPATLIKSNVPIPAFLQRVEMPATSDRQQTGYVGFASHQSGRWLQQQHAGLEDGQPFLFHQQAYIPLATVQFFLCMGASFQTMMAGKKGEFIFATQDMEIRMDSVIHKGNVCKLEPHYVCLLIVNLNGNLLPIKGDFRGTKSGGMENSIRAVETAATAEWLKLSDQHKATAAFPQPFGRVWNEIATERQVSKTTGNPYHPAKCTCTPATVSQMQLLVSALRDPDFTKQLTEVHTNYLARIEFLRGVIRGENRAKEDKPAGGTSAEVPNPF